VSGEDEVFGENGTLPHVGERLRVAREAQGLSLEDIAASTRIPKRHLQTIERGSYDGLPAPTYSAGFIKIWARQLGLNGQALADEFRAEIGGVTAESAQPLPYEPADPRRTPPAGLALLALLIAVVLGLGYLYWRGTSEQPAEIATSAGQQTAAKPAPPTGSVQGVPAPAAAPQANGPVVIGASGEVWVKVSDSGKTLFMNTLHPGDRFEVPASAVAPLMTTGRPGHTTIMVGQIPIPTVGNPDRAAMNISLKPADLLARIVTPLPATQPPANATTPVENSAGT
jgi:transcriptional regulator with XRE-family HTH domain